MWGPKEFWIWLKSKRRLNFITVHYIYLVSVTIVGSILLYPAGGLTYIDALFFASGTATQSGLNTVDVNRLNTYQQVVLYLVTMFCTPIFIHTFVVFLRLYWFERRFQNIVKESRNLRRTKSQTKTDLYEVTDTAEKGVRGRSIVVMHNGNTIRPGGGSSADPPEKPSISRSDSSNSRKQNKVNKEHTEEPNSQRIPTFHREITFADEVKNPESDDENPPILPQRLTSEQNIAFRENQRNPKDKSALRIPGPRDFERGDVPEPLESVDEESNQALRQVTSPLETTEGLDDGRTKQNVTIDDPNIHRDRAHPGYLPKLNTRKSGTLEHQNGAITEDVPYSARLKQRVGTFSSLRNWASKENIPETPYLSYQPTVGRNSAFVDLTEEQREELGGIEYRALKTLALVLVLYYVLFHLIGVILLLPWIRLTDTWGKVVDSDGINRTWWGIFTPASMFNDLGYTLTPDSMISFQRAVLPMILGSFLIVIGNTGFPCMLRFVIWIASHMAPRESGVWEEFRFLLDHPRRCFTLLFQSSATWWLFGILVILNGLDVIFFIVLDLHDPAITDIGSSGYRVLNALFQATSTRTAGFASVNLSNLHPGIQVSYLIMMYISVFPIAISIRRTNVYEEKSLGIYGKPNEEEEDDNEPSYIGAHLRRQLSFDLWYIFLGLFIIAIAEGSQIANTNEYAFTLFSVLFEIVSAYGTVGLSLGYPNINASFSAEFNVISKLVIIAMQIRGRHRGLPYELDRAILLPSEALHEKEDVDASNRAHRRNSMSASFINTPGPGMNSRTPTAGTSGGSAWPIGASPTVGITTGREDFIDSKLQGTSEHHSHHSGHAQKGIGRVMAGLADGPRLRPHEGNVSEHQKHLSS